MEHVVALAQAPTADAAIPDEVRAAARQLRDTPAAPLPTDHDRQAGHERRSKRHDDHRVRAHAGRRLAPPYVSENGYDTTWLPFDGGNRMPPTTPLMHP